MGSSKKCSQSFDGPPLFFRQILWKERDIIGSIDPDSIFGLIDGCLAATIKRFFVIQIRKEHLL
jgi:hypothetical protein